MIKLALSDIDDTLVYYGRGATPKAIEAIHAMQDAGLHFATATGRMASSISALLRDDARASATTVSVNGQLVLLDGEVIERAILPYDALVRTTELLRDEYGAMLTIYEEQGDSYAVGVSAEERAAFNDMFWPETGARLEVPDYEIVKANVHVHGTPERLASIRELLVAEVPEFDFVYPNPTVPLIDILPHGKNKATGADVLRRALGLEWDEVCAFGDAENDLTLLNAVPHSIAVANAMPVVAKAARWHIGLAADDAVADALFDIAHAAHAGSLPRFMRGA